MENILRESIPRQVDKKSRFPEEEKGVWGSQGGDKGLGILEKKERANIFFLHSLVLVT